MILRIRGALPLDRCKRAGQRGRLTDEQGVRGSLARFATSDLFRTFTLIPLVQTNDSTPLTMGTEASRPMTERPMKLCRSLDGRAPSYRGERATRRLAAERRFIIVEHMISGPDMPIFQRVAIPQHPRLRSEAILEAARDLALARDVRSVGMTSIARAAGITRPTLLRFFVSREQIFLVLTSWTWREWAEAVEQSLQSVSTDSRQLAVALTESLAEHPLFCDLLAQAPLNLEHNVSLETLQEYKVQTLAASIAAGDAIVAALTRLGLFVSPETGQELVSMITAQAAMIWQLSHPPQRLAELYTQDAHLAPTAIEFVPYMTQFICLLIMGLGGD
jgi:AcrR family transcriptional regulator